MNLYKSISDWLTTKYKPIIGWLYFNATPMITGTVAMNSVPGNRVVKKFINGSAQKEIVFAIDMVCNYDNQGTSDINMNAMDEVNNFADWVDKLSSSDYPDFGEYNSITKIEVLTNVPSLLVNTEQQLGKYQFQVKITYIDESEVIR